MSRSASFTTGESRSALGNARVRRARGVAPAADVTQTPGCPLPRTAAAPSPRARGAPHSSIPARIISCCCCCEVRTTASSRASCRSSAWCSPSNHAPHACSGHPGESRPRAPPRQRRTRGPARRTRHHRCAPWAAEHALLRQDINIVEHRRCSPKAMTRNPFGRMKKLETDSRVWLGRRW